MPQDPRCVMCRRCVTRGLHGPVGGMQRNGSVFCCEACADAREQARRAEWGRDYALHLRYDLRNRTAADVIRACAVTPQHPNHYFPTKGGRYRYAVFESLTRRGALKRCDVPGRRGYWFTATAEAVALLKGCA